jgi:hypothetical protein
MLVFKEEDHSYTWQGRRVPGITSLMEPIHSYDGVPDWVLERKADLGKAVHLACQHYDTLGADGTPILHEPSLDEQVADYFEGWKNFRKAHPGAIRMNEKPLYHCAHGYAGTPDRQMTVDTPDDVVEIKTTAQLFNAVGVQLAAQKALFIENNPMMKPTGKRFAVQLKPGGKFTLREYKDPRDWPTFLSLLSIHNWMARFGNK